MCEKMFSIDKSALEKLASALPLEAACGLGIPKQSFDRLCFNIFLGVATPIQPALT